MMKQRVMIRKLIAAVAKPALLTILVLLPGACQKAPPPAPPPPRVTVAFPLMRQVTEFLTLTGTTAAANTAQLVARVPGYLEKVFFQDGQMVRKGQPLFLIQQNTYEAALRQAEGQVLSQKAQLEYAGRQLARYQSLLPQHAASQTDVDNWRYQRNNAEANLKTAEANRDLARYNLGYTTVSSPFSGRIDRKLQDPGNLVGTGTGTVLAVVSQVDPLNVYFTISDSDFSRLVGSARAVQETRGDPPWPVYLGMTGEPGYPHQGWIDFTSVSFTPTTGTLLMRGVFPNPDARILPGLFTRVHVPVQTREAILVPDSSVGSDLEGPYVLVVNGQGVVERRGVRTGFMVDYLRVIEQGLTGQEMVVVRGMLKAVPGSRVTPVTEGSARTVAPPPSGGSAGRAP
jgi:RND family efflux transporter MFP subunit